MPRVALAQDMVNVLVIISTMQTSARDEYRFKIALVNTLKVIFLITIQRYLHSLIAIEFDNFSVILVSDFCFVYFFTISLK